MIALSSRPVAQNWVTISFASTLYLCPILDLLLADIPSVWQAEIRLGLQEALVNAAKHGNNLDPSKKVVVRFSAVQDQYWWVISDRGPGFQHPCGCNLRSVNSDRLPDYSISSYPAEQPKEEQECGRGLYILYQVFDRVEWNPQGTELTLCKQLKNSSRFPLVR